MIKNLNTNIDDDFDIGRILRYILMNSKLIVIFMAFGLFYSIYYYNSSPRIYKISSLLQVYSNSQMSPGSNFGIAEALAGSNSDIPNLIKLYKSRTNMLEVVSALKLNVVVESENDERVFFEEFNVKNVDFNGIKSFFIKIHDSEFSIFDEDKNLIQRANINTGVSSKLLTVKISNNSSLEKDKFYKIIYSNPEDIYKKYLKSISVESTIKDNSYFRYDGLINVSFNTDKVNNGINLVNLANQVFLDNNIESETEKARKAIEFIDQRLVSVNKILTESKNKLKDFKELNKSINVDLEIQTILQNISKIDESISDVNIELAESASQYTKTNPIYKNLIQRKEALSKQRSFIENKILQLPVAQQKYIDLFRDVEVSTELYAELLNLKLSYSIMEASTLGNIRVIDSAYRDNLVGPTIFMAISIFLFFLIMGVIVALIKSIFFTSVSNPAELSDNNINNKIIGVLPNLKDKDQFDERFKQSIESLVVNINSNIAAGNTPGVRTILITSPTAGNGKSFISQNISRKLADLGNKVLLMDLDLKRGIQHKEFLQKLITKEDFFSIQKNNLEQYKTHHNHYLIPRITNLPSSFEFLYSNEFHETMLRLKSNFDYIIIDTAPILSVSDTSVLISYSDNNFSIVRHGLSKINEIKQSIHSINQLGKDFDGIIYNDYQKPSGYYGYYGVYGNYGYQYYAQKYLYDTYDYKKD